MYRWVQAVSVLGLLCLFFAGSNWLTAQTAAPHAGQQPQGLPIVHHPGLFFREDWKLGTGVPNTSTEDEPEHPVFQGDVANPNLEVRVYGDKDGVRIADQTYNQNTTYVMSLLSTSNWAATLRDKNNDVDLTGLATIRWRTRISGFHYLHPILKLADGTWLIGDKAASFSTDWVESEIELLDVRWKRLDIDQVVENHDGKWVDKPDLSRVEEIGFTDLMRGGGHGSGGGSRVDWIEVYGKPVPRAAAGNASTGGR
jgi:hypothetical protein